MLGPDVKYPSLRQQPSINSISNSVNTVTDGCNSSVNKNEPFTVSDSRLGHPNNDTLHIGLKSCDIPTPN